MAFVRNIYPSGTQGSDSHQTSPAYMIVFTRFQEKRIFREQDKALRQPTEKNDMTLKDPLIVVSDCIQVSVNSSKSSHIHQASMTLMAGDVNYATAVTPGDFVTINLVNSDAMIFGLNGTPNNPSENSLYSRASRGSSAINNSDDGFKGIFKVQSVRKILAVQPNGPKTFHYQITAAAFTEFNQVVYFNPFLFTEQELKTASNVLNASATLEWASINKNLTNLRGIFKSFVGFLIGEGFGNKLGSQKGDVVRNFNQNFQIPKGVGNLLGLTGGSSHITAADLFEYNIGIEQYDFQTERSLKSASKMSISDSISMVPLIKSKDGNFNITGANLSGVAIIQAEPWCQVTAWSILNQYSNSLINEMFTAFKVTSDGSVMPVVTFRQKPFSSMQFKKTFRTIDCTPFLSLPRWHIDPGLITTLSLGRDEAARINFVHITGKTRFIDLKNAAINQAASNLHRYDAQDIKRNGLRPFIASCDFDFPSSESKNMQAGKWNELMFDWLSNGHLKENGTIVCAGLEEPIAIGDNLEVNHTVLHIESIAHVMQLNPDGTKSFRTTMQLSYGVDLSDEENGVQKYPEDTFPDAESYRTDDHNHQEQMLPGFSDSQDVAHNTNGEKTTQPKTK